MTAERKGDTRRRILESAAELISESPGQDVPLRAICDRVGVRLPTLYHFFGSKDGLLDAVVRHGFETYLALKREHESSGDAIQDLRDGWDAHVTFGLANPGFYALMYGQIRPGHRPAADAEAGALLLALTTAAAEEGRLAVSPEAAAAQILSANVGVTLHLITDPDADPRVSTLNRDAVLAAVTGSGSGGAEDIGVAAKRLLALLPTAPTPLGAPETALLRKWLKELSRPADGEPRR